MSFVANQISNMMINTIKKNNPKMTPYLNELANGGDANAVLRKAIQSGAISKQQWLQAKPMLQRFGSQMGVKVSQDDLNALDKEFNKGGTTNNNNGGFRF